MKLRKRRQKWENACMDSGLQPHKLKTPIKTRLVKGNHVSRNFGIQSNNFVVLWQAKNIKFVVMSLEGPSVGHC